LDLVYVSDGYASDADILAHFHGQKPIGWKHQGEDRPQSDVLSFSGGFKS
jgi:hypothetical protein